MDKEYLIGRLKELIALVLKGYFGTKNRAELLNRLTEVALELNKTKDE